MQSNILPIDYEYSAVKKAIDKLLSTYNFLRCKPIGRSCAGREIFCLQIGEADEYVLYAAAFHGSEHITTNIALRFVEEVCEALLTGGEIAGIDARRALYGRGILVVPLVNPDGCEISIKGEIGAGYMAPKIKRLCGGKFQKWNANLRGVDINHNFDAGWNELRALEKAEGIYGPSPTRFGGYSPESEPETRALTELCRRVKMRHVIALHTQGEVIYWSYGDKQPARSAKMAEIMAAESGYALEVPTGLASHGGFKDWFIGEMKKPGFTIEIGKGENPLPISALPKLYDSVREALILASIM